MDQPNSEAVELYQKGILANRAKAYDEAIVHFRKVMTLVPPKTQYYVSSRHNIACNLMSKSLNNESGQNYSVEALRLWREGVEDEHPSSMYYLAVYLERQNDAEALGLYIQAAKLGNDDAKRALSDIGLSEILLR